MRRLYSTLLLISLASITTCAQNNGQVAAQTIPQFLFFQLDNKPFTDNDLPKGQTLFIMFFDADCDRCQRAIENIGEHFQAFKKTPVFLISVDNRNKIDHFMNTYGNKLKGQKNVNILVDKLQQFMVKFHPLRYPAMFIFSPEKKLLDYEDNPESVFRLVNIINKNVKWSN